MLIIHVKQNFNMSNFIDIFFGKDK